MDFVLIYCSPGVLSATNKPQSAEEAGVGPWPENNGTRSDGSLDRSFVAVMKLRESFVCCNRRGFPHAVQRAASPTDPVKELK